jgi:cephalosporin hydroxylase
MNYQIEEEFMQLRAIVAALQPRVTVEIGSLTGETLKHWIQLTREHLVSVDLVVPLGDHRHQEQRSGHDILWPKLAEEKGIKFHCFDADSTAPATVWQVWKAVGHMAAVDFLFIDAGHDYRQASMDYLNYGPLVRKGGVIAFHDRAGHEWPEVKRVWDMVKRWHRCTQEIGDVMGIGVIWV